MAMLNNQMINLMEDAVAIFFNDRRCDKMWDVNGCHRLLGMMGITLCEMSPSKKTCNDHMLGWNRKAWLQLTFSHLSICMCMCCSYRIIPCLKKETTTSNMVNLCQS